jgi:ketosteroid isomerase-like protein
MGTSRAVANAPAELHALWMAAMNRGDLDGLVELYEPYAVMMLDPDEPVLRGVEAIRAALAPHVAVGARVENATVAVLEGADVAYLCSSWRISTQGADGEPLTLAGSGAEVARRQGDGSWLLAVDHAYGAG